MASPYVVMMIRPSSEAFAAVLAGVGPVSCMASHMDDKVRIGLELLPTARSVMLFLTLGMVVWIGACKLLLPLLECIVPLVLDIRTLIDDSFHYNCMF